MSLKLFAIYVDDLTLSLIKSKIGSMLDEVCFNHIFYGDDLCLLAPCAIYPIHAAAMINKKRGSAGRFTANKDTRHHCFV